jgi:hypothetical protein
MSKDKSLQRIFREVFVHTNSQLMYTLINYRIDLERGNG